MKKIIIDSDSSTIALSGVPDNAPVGASSTLRPGKRFFVVYLKSECVLVEGQTGRIVESADNIKELVSAWSGRYNFFVFEDFPYLNIWASGAVNTEISVSHGDGGRYTGEITYTYELRRYVNGN